jgi:formate hydrogenlyase subunit 3/multisubunit Na+/H+ antiporter MnhD subunit
VSQLVAIIAALPLASAMLATVFGRHGAALAAVAVFGMLTAITALVIKVARGGVLTIEAGGWSAPLGITLQADGLACAFLAMTALVMAGVVAQGRTHFAYSGPDARAVWAFWPLTMLLWLALNVVFLSRDLFNLYVGLELMSLAAVALVAIEGKPEMLAAALRYMLVALLGSLLYLIGTVLLYSAHGVLDLRLVAGRTSAPADLLAVALMTAGLAAKMALFPFHAWLPPAHSGAPAPASAMLSALVPKAAFVILIRLWFEAVPDLASTGILMLLGGVGAAAIMHGGLMALRQDRLKLVIAYSTVAQIGYLLLIFPLAGGESAAQPWAAGAWNGAVFHALSHGLAKAAMFLCAGVWMVSLGHDRLEGLRGQARATPMAVFAFGLAAITLMGLPPSGGFVAKYLLLTSAIASGQWGWVVVLLGGGLLTAAYLYRPLAALLAKGDEIPAPVPRSQQAVPLVLAGAAIVLGIASGAPFEFLQIGHPETAAEGLE